MFKTPLNFLSRLILDLQYGTFINHQNLESVSRFKLWLIFKNEDNKVKNVYLHHVIDCWVKFQDQQNPKFLTKLKRIIRKTKIVLSPLDLHDLNLIEERIFSTYRHIKVLDVEYKLLDKELALAKFTNGELYGLKNARLKLVLNGNLLMTNRRFIIYNEAEHLAFSYRSLKNFKFTSYGLEFTNSHQVQLTLRIHDQVTLNNTFWNLIRKRAKWLVKHFHQVQVQKPQGA